MNYTDDSWIWEEDNICENITNHWLYFVFSGYVLPLISPRIRDWLKETLNSLKNNKIGGEIVTLTEFGFQKIQDIENNDEMKEYIRRIVKQKNPSLFYSEESLEKLAILFSGDETKNGFAQSWIKLNKMIELGDHSVKVVRP